MGSEYHKLPSDHHRVKNYASIPYLHHEEKPLAPLRPKRTVFHLFLGAFALSLFALFTTRSLKNSNLFQTESLEGNHVIDFIKEIPSTESLHDFYLKYASTSSVAGDGRDLAQWTRDQWEAFGLKNASLETYYPYLNYPKKRALSIVNGQDILYEVTLLESDEDIPMYHAYSASGNVTGPVVYVNYGRTEDFEWLKKKKVHVKGAIALIRHGVVPSSLKLYNAELYGCIGALVFIDPSDTDPIEKKTFTSDDDKTIHSWSIPVKRESVEYGFIHPGDPFTPGFAATLNATRLNETTALPQIPSLPISWSDALPLFHTTEGHGETKKSWKGGLSQAKYFTGPSKSMVNLVNINELAMKPVWNVVGQIKGHEEPDKAIVIGSHRDSLGDYADASSGSAVLLELVRVFGILLEKGWRPRRTIVIASWDANEYGNTGSTEWVEDHLHWLSKEAIAYINLDNAITGSRFSAEGSPLLHRLIMEVTAMVVDPRTGVSVYETWLSSSTPTTMDNEDDEDDYLSLIRPPGTSSGLDTLPFFEFAGVSSLSLSFESGGDESDSLWIKEEFQDPLFEYHQTMVKILGLLAFRLSDDILIPLYPVDYTLAMKQHLKELTREPSEDQLSTFKKENKTSHANALPKLAHSLSKLLHTSMQFHEKVEGLENKAVVNKHRSHKLLKHINRANERLVLFERALLNKNGLLMGRPWHKHTIYGPSIQTGLVAPFPAIQEVRALDNSTLLAEVEKSLSHTLENAKRVLQGKRLHSDENDKEDDDNDNHVNFVE